MYFQFNFQSLLDTLSLPSSLISIVGTVTNLLTRYPALACPHLVTRFSSCQGSLLSRLCHPFLNLVFAAGKQQSKAQVQLWGGLRVVGWHRNGGLQGSVINAALTASTHGHGAAPFVEGRQGGHHGLKDIGTGSLKSEKSWPEGKMSLTPGWECSMHRPSSQKCSVSQARGCARGMN